MVIVLMVAEHSECINKVYTLKWQKKKRKEKENAYWLLTKVTERGLQLGCHLSG